jgi:hypothetical protein
MVRIAVSALVTGLACSSPKPPASPGGGAPEPLSAGLARWSAGDVTGALAAADGRLVDAPDDGAALDLRMKALFVTGDYRGALDACAKIPASYEHRKRASALAVEAYLHLDDGAAAAALSREAGLESAGYLARRAATPFAAEADRTYLVPFLDGGRIPVEFFPGVNGTLNGLPAEIRFDTGGTFLVLGRAAAGKYGIELGYEFDGMHAATAVEVSRGIAKELTFDGGPRFVNVPVAVMESLGDLVIFGTNILERFLATVDYPNRRFILTPRDREDLREAHLALLPAERRTLPFSMWGDHYMFAKGSYGERQGLNLFFDSGLVAITIIDGKPVQAPFTASRQTLIAWGFDEDRLNETAFLPSGEPLGAAGLSQPDTLIFFDAALEEDREFGGVRIHGLISHAWLDDYTWTIDFDAMEYTFGVPAATAGTSSTAVQPTRNAATTPGSGGRR